MEGDSGSPSLDDRLRRCAVEFEANLRRFEHLTDQASRIVFQTISAHIFHQELVADSQERIEKSRIVLYWTGQLLRALQSQHQVVTVKRAQPLLNSREVTLDRAMLLKHLAPAEKHIDTGARNITRPKKNVAKLELRGAEVREARQRLANFEHTQVLFLAERKRTKEELIARRRSIRSPSERKQMCDKHPDGADALMAKKDRIGAKGMGTAKRTESLRWEAQRLLIEADQLDKLRRGYLKRAAALAARADLIERDSPMQLVLPSLSPEEASILSALRDGLSNEAISSLQGLDIETVRSRSRAVMTKLHVGSRAELMRAASDLIERAAFDKGVPRGESAGSSSSPRDVAPFPNWILVVQDYLGALPHRMPSRADLACAIRSFVSGSSRARIGAMVLTPLAVLTAIAWLVTAYQVQDMNAPMSAGIEMSGSSMASLLMGGPLAFFVVWPVMMAAMMLPSEAPMLLTFAALVSRRRDNKKPLVSTGLFAGGYLLVWALVGVAVYFVLWAGSALVSKLPIGERELVVGLTLATVLIGAGLYQFTPVKRVFLAHCRSPVAFISSHWRDGRLGALRIGLHHGAHCLGCCWTLFAVQLAVGVTSLTGMLVLTLIVFLEKVLPQGQRIAVGIGGALILVGVFIAGTDLLGIS
jgi:predicted metal-binding membrane protein/DNA-binding CsgD family transcriptional regulator